MVIRPLLGVGTRVLASWPASAAVGGIAFSPRGESLVFSLRESSEGPARIVRLSLEDKALEELTAPPITSLGDTLPAFSPDGSQVAFVRRSLKNAHDVYTVPVEGGVAVRRSVLEGKIPGLAWSTAGLFLTRFPAGRQSLWRLDPETGDTTRWTLPARFPTRLAAAGARVVVTDSGNDSDIAVVSGGEVRRRIRSTAWDASPHLSTSAGRLVFFSSRSGNGEIWSSDLESGELRRLTRFDGSLALHPRLSPDGRRLAFDRRRNDRSDIYLMDLGGGEPRALVDTWGNDLLPTWSLDGETIYFVSDRGGRWGLWSRPADGSGSPRFLAEGWCFALEDPATGGLVVSRQKAPGLWFLRAPAGESGVPAVFEPWAEAPVPAEWGLWALEGHRVVAVTRRQSRYLLEAFDRRTGQTEELARLPASPENPGLAVAGERVWLGLAAPPEADLLLVEGL